MVAGRRFGGLSDRYPVGFAAGDLPGLFARLYRLWDSLPFCRGYWLGIGIEKATGIGLGQFSGHRHLRITLCVYYPLEPLIRGDDFGTLYRNFSCWWACFRSTMLGDCGRAKRLLDDLPY